MVPDNDNSESHDDRLSLIAGLIARVRGPRRRSPLWGIFTAAAIMMTIPMALAWWQTQPITPHHVTQLRGLARLAADRRAESTQAVCARLHRQFGVRRTEDIRRVDYGQATEMLMKEAR